MILDFRHKMIIFFYFMTPAAIRFWEEIKWTETVKAIEPEAMEISNGGDDQVWTAQIIQGLDFLTTNCVNGSESLKKLVTAKNWKGKKVV